MPLSLCVCDDMCTQVCDVKYGQRRGVFSEEAENMGDCTLEWGPHRVWRKKGGLEQEIIGFGIRRKKMRTEGKYEK